MPQANGKHYRSFGQGYRAEKEASAQSVQEKPHSEEQGSEGGSIAHVKHNGGGKFSIKLEHKDGSSSSAQAESPEEMQSALSQHFGVASDGDGDGQLSDQESMDYDGEDDDGAALKSILG